MNELLKSRKNNMNSRIIRIIDIKKLEKSILDYVLWLKKTNRVDKIDNYAEFLQL